MCHVASESNNLPARLGQGQHLHLVVKDLNEVVEADDLGLSCRALAQSRQSIKKDAYGAAMKKDEHGKNTKRAWEVDHIKPKAKGGSNKLSNLRSLQKDNNRRKEDKTSRGAARKPKKR